MSLDPHSEQLELELDWGSEPWGGVSPRWLTRLRIVEKSRTLPKPATVMPTFTDPAQLTTFLKGTQYGS